MGFSLLLFSCSVVPDSPVDPWPHSLLCPWNFSGRNTGVGCHPSPKDLPDSGTEPSSLVSSLLAGRVFTTVSPGKLSTQPFFFCFSIKSENIAHHSRD